MYKTTELFENNVSRRIFGHKQRRGIRVSRVSPANMVKVNAPLLSGVSYFTIINVPCLEHKDGESYTMRRFIIGSLGQMLLR
jgi:hypothetical protein